VELLSPTDVKMKLKH